MKSECVIWQGRKNNKGYPVYDRSRKLGKKTILVHRDYYETFHGIEIPPGLVIRHQCDNPPCINPHHLVIGTMKDNSQDMVERMRYDPHQARKTHCPQGHEYTEENTYRPPNRKERQCRTCIRDRAREKYRKTHNVTKFRVQL